VDDAGAVLEEECAVVIAVVSEGFYYQLHAQPTWQAICFLYQRTSLRGFLAENSIVMPAKANVMIAAFDLTDLHIGHGQTGSVMGFDHSPLDTYKEGWCSYSFPYKLGGYRKQLRSMPTKVLSFDYSVNTSSIPETSITCPFTTTGPYDCLAIWIDYDLIDDIRIDCWEGDNFPPYLKTFVRFFPQRGFVRKPMEETFTVNCSFEWGDSDIRLDFTAGV
jgi:hypothetical protein